MLSTYTNEKVYGYDISKKILKQYDETMINNGIDNTVSFLKANGKEEAEITFNDNGKGSGNINNEGI